MWYKHAFMYTVEWSGILFESVSRKTQTQSKNISRKWMPLLLQLFILEFTPDKID